MRDFTIGKYTELCRTLLDAGYIPRTICQYLSGAKDGMGVLLRHDVDRKPKNALRMAELERELGIHSTYYFRHPYTFIPEIIRQIYSFGHEVGYHYEVLAKARGDYKKAIGLFSHELEEFRSLCDVQTICMHGSPLSRYNNRELWSKYDFRDFRITGEAYLSMTGKGFRYLTDTGRSWNSKYSVRDALPGSSTVPVETTDDLIAWIESSGERMLYLTVHPQRWAISEVDRIAGSAEDGLMNIGKRVILRMRVSR